MKRFALSLMSLTAVAATAFLVACDWESGSQANFNSSVSNVNISGVYRGQLSGGRAVSNTSAGNITTLNIQQSGDSVTVRDNQGSTYQGRVSAPDIRSDVSGGSLTTGTTVVAYQLGFSGRDGVAGRDIEFSGSLTLGTITNVVSNNSNSSNGVVSNVNTVTVENDGTSTRTTTTDEDSETGSSSSNQFTLNESNSIMRLQGTWIEQGGVVANVNALAPVNAFTITTSAP